MGFGKDKMNLLNFLAKSDMGASLFETDEHFDNFTNLKIPDKNDLLTSPSQIETDIATKKLKL